MGVLNSFKMEPITRDSMTSTVTASQESSQKSPNPLTGLSLCHAPQEALKTQQPTNQCVCVLVASLTCSLSMGFSRQEYWSGVPFPSPADLPNPGVKPRSFALQADSLTSEPGEFPGVFFFLLRVQAIRKDGRAKSYLHLVLCCGKDQV